MSFVEYPPFQAGNLVRTFEAHVPRKFLRDIKNRVLRGPGAPQSDELLFVDPARIIQSYVPDRAKGAPNFRRRHSGHIKGGDWDLSVKPLQDSDKYLSCKAHFENGVPWEQTDVFARHLKVIAESGESDECRNIDELRRRYERLDRLFETVQATGRLLPRREVASYFRREHGGIFVHINRNGQPLRRGGGEHRFAIARLLQLPEIPVQPGVIHTRAVIDGHIPRLRHSVVA